MLTHIGSGDFEGRRVRVTLLAHQVGRILLERRHKQFGAAAVHLLDAAPVVDVLQLQQRAGGADDILQTDRQDKSYGSFRRQLQLHLAISRGSQLMIRV